MNNEIYAILDEIKNVVLYEARPFFSDIHGEENMKYAESVVNDILDGFYRKNKINGFLTKCDNENNTRLGIENRELVVDVKVCFGNLDGQLPTA